MTAVVQLHPQLHHLDALDELPKGRGAKGKKDEDERPAEAEARAVDVKIKGADDGGAMLVGNLDLLKKMQDEKWKKFDWVDAEVSRHCVTAFRAVCFAFTCLMLMSSRLRSRGIPMRTI